MRHNMNRTLREERGQSLVEMALVLPLLLLLRVGIVDLGRGFHHAVIVTNAAREGARAASRFPNEQEAQRQVIVDAITREMLNSHVQITDPDINIEILGANVPAGQPITVKVTYDYHTILGGLLGINDGIIKITRASTMIVYGVDS